MRRTARATLCPVALLALACATGGAGPTPQADDDTILDAFIGGESISLIGDPRMDDLAYWALSYVWNGSADVGEILQTTSRIEAGNVQSWYDEWMRTAARLETEGDGSLARGHGISAGASYLRASRYYRAALSVYGDANAPGLMVAARKSVDSFVRAMDGLRYDMTRVKIPYEGTHLPGYWLRSPSAPDSAPVLIIQSGWDSWPEDEKHFFDGALDRGYHALLIHGPGQGMALREQGLSFRPDWEAVVGPVIDFLVAQPGVDPDRIAMLGISFGGFLVPRAAVYEHRLAACITNPGLYDYPVVARSLLPPEILQAAEQMPPAEFDRFMEGLLAASPQLRPMWQHGTKVLGAKRPSDFMGLIEQYSLVGLADQIRCKSLVLDGTRDFFGDQGRALYDALRAPKEYVLFTDETGGTLHCRQGVQALMTSRTFDWLDENL